MTVAGEAQKNWNSAALSGKLKVIIINFHAGDKPSVDVDNMSKPILDAMQKSFTTMIARSGKLKSLMYGLMRPS